MSATDFTAVKDKLCYLFMWGTGSTVCTVISEWFCTFGQRSVAAVIVSGHFYIPMHYTYILDLVLYTIYSVVATETVSMKLKVIGNEAVFSDPDWKMYTKAMDLDHDNHIYDHM